MKPPRPVTPQAIPFKFLYCTETTYTTTTSLTIDGTQWQKLNLSQRPVPIQRVLPSSQLLKPVNRQQMLTDDDSLVYISPIRSYHILTVATTD